MRVWLQGAHRVGLSTLAYPRPLKPKSSSWSSNRICPPSAHWTSSVSRAPHSVAAPHGGPEALGDHRSRPDRVWNRIPEDVRRQIIDWHSRFQSRRESWPQASPTKKGILSLRRVGPPAAAGAATQTAISINCFRVNESAFPFLTGVIQSSAQRGIGNHQVPHQACHSGYIRNSIREVREPGRRHQR
jgi:hypothetical protein